MKVKQSTILAKLPQKLAERLMPFQREGVEFAVNKNGKCLIADEMGLGKTIQAISVAYYYKAEWPLLIIVPSSLRYCWIEEFEKWLPEINPGDINLIQSGNDASGIDGAKVTIVTFGLLSKSTTTIVREALMAKAFQVVIVDESHYIRNIKTVSAKTVVPLIKNANRRILLSGTPALARPVELYPQVDAIAPDKFGSWWAYTNRYCDAKTEWVGKVRRRNINGASNLQELQEKLSSLLMIRREKETVLTQLPPKQRQKILFELKQSELTKEIRKTFEELRPLLKRGSTEKFEVLTGAGDDVKDTNMLSLIQRLYQLSGEAKIGPAREYVDMLCDNPNLKFLVFAYHRSMMNGLSQTLYDRNIKFIRIDGDTPPSERPQLVQQFQSDPDTRVAVLSILAAGVILREFLQRELLSNVGLFFWWCLGLTFTAATVVVFAEMYWTPGVMVQCEDRAHRIGQSSCVAVHYLVAKDTMDEWVWSAVCKKTIVTSTTLTGKKKAMTAEAGDSYQVDVLSSADAWIPKDNNDLDLSSYFQTHQDNDQKSILDFFSSQKSNVSSPRTPSSQSQKSQNSSTTPTNSGVKGKSLLCSPLSCLNDSCTTPEQSKVCSTYFTPMSDTVSSSSVRSDQSTPQQSGKHGVACKRARTENAHHSSAIVVIDSDTDDDFAESNTPLKSSKSSLSRKSLGSSKSSKKRKLKNSQKSKSKSRLLAMWSKLDSDDCVEVTSLDDSDGDTNRDDDTLAKSSYSKNQESTVRQDVGEVDKDEIKDQSGAQSHPTSGLEVATSKSSEKSSESNAGWSCGACTYLNHKDLKYCEICETPKKHKQFDDRNNDTLTPVKNGKQESAVCVQEPDKAEENLLLDEDEITQYDSDICEDLEIQGSYQSDREDLDQCSNDDNPDCNFMNTDICSNEDVLKTPKMDKGQSDGNRNATPTASLKKYKFKSVRRSEGVIGSPEVTKAKAERKTGNSQDFEDQLEDSFEIDDVDLSQEILGDKTDVEPCDTASQEEDKRIVDIDSIPVHSMFKYKTSKYTGRVYLYTQEEEPMHMNFVPLDVEVGNLDALPEVLLHPSNLRLVQKFIREWQSLTETKRRLVIKAGRVFVSPLREYDDLRSCKTVNTQRHQTKIDTAVAAKKAAASVNGSVRVISRSAGVRQPTEDIQDLESQTGVMQAVAEDGTPLCLQCFKPYSNQLLQKSSIHNTDNAWQTRFCSQKCSHDYWIVTNNDYLRDKVYEAERGVCQMCGLDAHSCFRQIKDTADMQKRATLISKSKFNSLALKTKQQMARKPVAGQFWHVDHIKPVWEGGGQCDIDNLRTLCVMCHQKITAKQAAKRATVRKLGSAVNSGDITAFFQRS